MKYQKVKFHYFLLSSVNPNGEVQKGGPKGHPLNDSHLTITVILNVIVLNSGHLI